MTPARPSWPPSSGVEVAREVFHAINGELDRRGLDRIDSARYNVAYETACSVLSGILTPPAPEVASEENIAEQIDNDYIEGELLAARKEEKS